VFNAEPVHVCDEILWHTEMELFNDPGPVVIGTSWECSALNPCMPCNQYKQYMQYR